VQSSCLGWTVSSEEAVAEGSLNCLLLLGRLLSPRRRASDGAGLDAQLAGMPVEVWCDGRLVERGEGAKVLDGPLHACCTSCTGCSAAARRSTCRSATS
jgi:hypothetical protein